MKSFRQFMLEVYDPAIQGRSSIKKPHSGGRIEPERKKTAPEKRRTKAVGGGKTAPAKEYKPRKDIGQQRPAGRKSARLQQPTGERGAAKLSPREQQRKARAERIAAKSSGQSKKDLEKAATKLLTKKKDTVDPKYKPQKASGYTRPERRKLQRAGDRLISDIRKKKDKPAGHYNPKL